MKKVQIGQVTLLLSLIITGIDLGLRILGNNTSITVTLELIMVILIALGAVFIATGLYSIPHSKDIGSFFPFIAALIGANLIHRLLPWLFILPILASIIFIVKIIRFEQTGEEKEATQPVDTFPNDVEIKNAIEELHQLRDIDFWGIILVSMSMALLFQSYIQFIQVGRIPILLLLMIEIGLYLALGRIITQYWNVVEQQTMT